MRYTDKYTTELSQGTAMINETLLLLPYYKIGMTANDLYDLVIKEGVLPSLTPKRTLNIINKVFFNRFVKNNPNLPCWLLEIRKKGLLLSDFAQIIMVYCARSHKLYYDFILNVLNPLREKNETLLPRNYATDFIQSIVKNNHVNWSETMQKKNAGYLRNTLNAFNQVNSKREILPNRVTDFSILYFLHELHFSGLSNEAIVNDSDWLLLGLTKEEVYRKILDMNIKGGYIAQRSGDLLSISWRYKTMEEFINAVL